MKQHCESILEAIGDTPMVRLNHIVSGLPCTVYLKLETVNPGNSIKDRIGLKMIEDAEKRGLIGKGSTIIESTSGNTGVGIALVCAIKKYRCILTIKDKTSKEKVEMLKAYGAEIVMCPSEAEASDPCSCYSVAERLSKEIPDSLYMNQYENKANPLAYYESLAPEIWEQTEGKITHFIAAIGTGGTIIGVGKFLKEKNRNIKVWGVEPYGSMLKRYHDTGVVEKEDIYPYAVEGFGQNFLPGIYDMSYIDEIFKVSDKDCTYAARDLIREEGICVGFSTGAQVACILQNKDCFKKEDILVLTAHDSGMKYMSKIFNDEWLKAHFPEE